MELTKERPHDDPTEATVFPRFLRATAAAYGDAPALTMTGTAEPDYSLSFAQIERRSAELARGLIARGIGKS